MNIKTPTAKPLKPAPSTTTPKPKSSTDAAAGARVGGTLPKKLDPKDVAPSERSLAEAYNEASEEESPLLSSLSEAYESGPSMAEYAGLTGGDAGKSEAPAGASESPGAKSESPAALPEGVKIPKDLSLPEDVSAMEGTTPATFDVQKWSKDNVDNSTVEGIMRSALGVDRDNPKFQETMDWIQQANGLENPNLIQPTAEGERGLIIPFGNDRIPQPETSVGDNGQRVPDDGLRGGSEPSEDPALTRARQTGSFYVPPTTAADPGKGTEMRGEGAPDTGANGQRVPDDGLRGSSEQSGQGVADDAVSGPVKGDRVIEPLVVPQGSPDAPYNFEPEPVGGNGQRRPDDGLRAGDSSPLDVLKDEQNWRAIDGFEESRDSWNRSRYIGGDTLQDLSDTLRGEDGNSFEALNTWVESGEGGKPEWEALLNQFTGQQEGSVSDEQRAGFRGRVASILRASGDLAQNNRIEQTYAEQHGGDGQGQRRYVRDKMF